jgi:selenocysteine lyase/cysteine desulfurase
VYSRIHELAREVYRKAAARSYLELYTPENEAMYGALVSSRPKVKDLTPLFEACSKRRIWILQGSRLRISTHVHTRRSDIDALFEVMDRLYGKGE